jgi:hypothetical protein
MNLQCRSAIAMTAVKHGVLFSFAFKCDSLLYFVAVALGAQRSAFEQLAYKRMLEMTIDPIRILLL